MKAKAASDRAVDRHVSTQETPALAVAYGDADLAAHVVLGVLRDEDLVDAAFFDERAHRVLHAAFGRRRAMVGALPARPEILDQPVRPALLRADNFTPAARTPWGGRAIVTTLKPGLAHHEGPVGESWELSVEPDFPSTLEDGRLLSAVLAEDPVAWLGPVAAPRLGTSLLVKLLDARDALSVQIHPSDDYAGLGEGEGGKPESWYVTHAEPGAALYIGLAHGVTRASLEAALGTEADVSALLGRVEVAPGDFFVIEAGTPHAIGPGITLVEPQCVTPGRRGLTYRFWDWNRRYDASGMPSPDGAPRALHVAHALAVTDFDAPRGDALFARIRVRAGRPDLDAKAVCTSLAHEDGPLVSKALEVARLSGHGDVALPAASRLRGITVLEGVVVIDGVRITRGRTAAVPAALAGTTVTLERAHAIVSSAISG